MGEVEYDRTVMEVAAIELQEELCVVLGESHSQFDFELLHALGRERGIVGVLKQVEDWKSPYEVCH